MHSIWCHAPAAGQAARGIFLSIDPLPESLDQDLILLGDLLLVRAERGLISPSRQARGETWTDVAQRAVVAAESEGYADEQAVLKRILGDARVNCEVHSVHHTDLAAVRHLTNRWVVLLSLDGDDLDLTSVADRLTEEERGRLAFRTFFIFESDGRLSPLGSLKLGVERLWPAEVAELTEIASRIHGDLIETSHLDAVVGFATALQRASRTAHLLRVRRGAGLPAGDQNFRNLLQTATQAVTTLQRSLQPEAIRLLERVTPQTRPLPAGDERARHLCGRRLSSSKTESATSGMPRWSSPAREEVAATPCFVPLRQDDARRDLRKTRPRAPWSNAGAMWSPACLRGRSRLLQLLAVSRDRLTPVGHEY